jgi:hypothetical protein
MADYLTEKQYLGDGVYAKFENYQIVLTAEDGTRATNTIYLDESVLVAFERYIQKVREALDAQG